MFSMAVLANLPGVCSQRPPVSAAGESDRLSIASVSIARNCNASAANESIGDELVHVACDAAVQSRRAALCLLGSVSFSLIHCDAAPALGFPGVKDWLKGQKQRTAQFLLAPIDASRDRLNSALLLISKSGISKEGVEEAGRLVKTASRDCMPSEVGSVLDFQGRSGVEVCTFKLVLKNAASLLDNADPTKQKAEEALQDLIRSFVVLDGLLATDTFGDSFDREIITGAMQEAYVALDRFEGGVRACLGIA